MEDPDLIARLYPVFEDPYYADALDSLRLNRSRLEQDPIPCLELRFSNPPKKGSGFSIGTEDENDIILKKIPHVSRHQCDIKFEKSFDNLVWWLVVRDYGSENGTSVTYDGKGGNPRKDSRWIVGHHDILKDKKIVIEFNTHLKFEIVVAHYEVMSPEHTANVEYLQSRTLATAPGNSLVARPNSARPRSTTPSAQDEVLLDCRKLGHGTFSVVRLCWDVNSGAYFAVKEPKTGEFDFQMWKKESAILRRISHVSFEWLH
jgi:hypothetical protein